MQSRLSMVVLFSLSLGAAACTGMPDGSGGNDDVVASLQAGDAPRSQGVSQYAVVAMTGQSVKVYALSSSGTRLATYSATRTSTGFSGQLAAPTGTLSVSLKVTSSGVYSTFRRTISDGSHSVMLDHLVNRSTRKLVSATWWVNGKSVSLQPGALLTRAQSFLYQNGALTMLRSPLANLLLAIANDPNLRGYGNQAVYDIDWGSGLGCLIDTVEGAVAGGAFGAAVGAATSDDCWSFGESLWDWLFS